MGRGREPRPVVDASGQHRRDGCPKSARHAVQDRGAHAADEGRDGTGAHRRSQQPVETRGGRWQSCSWCSWCGRRRRRLGHPAVPTKVPLKVLQDGSARVRVRHSLHHPHRGRDSAARGDELDVRERTRAAVRRLGSHHPEKEVDEKGGRAAALAPKGVAAAAAAADSFAASLASTAQPAAERVTATATTPTAEPVAAA